MASLHARLAAIPSYLFLVSASRQIPDTHGGPPELDRYSRQTLKHSGIPFALWHFKQVQQRLTADALEPIKEVNLAAHALQTQAPGVDVLCRGSLGCFYSVPE